MNDPVTLLLLQHLFPTWTIKRDAQGTWTAAGRTLISSSDVDGLLAKLHVADPDAVHQAVSLLKES
ncbi:hypothetical protein [Actinomadura monticuli]|uniref:Uncharacterized protein n=1 Tax=Actinomadura monticuli TaxID=3097367 RepID=A0ABV4Q7Z4_9ACTN